MRRNIFDSIGIGLFFVSALLVFFLSIYVASMMTSIADYMDEDIEQRLLAISRNLASQIEPEEVAELMVPDDMEKPLYGELKQRLINFAEENNVLYAYYYILSPDGSNTLQPVIDNDLTEDSYTLETEPLEMEEAPFIALSGKAATTQFSIYSEGYSGLLSAFAPIFSSDGKSVLAIAGIDITDEQIIAVRNSLRTLSLLLVACILIVVVSGSFNVFLHIRRERQLRERLSQQELLSSISQSFITVENSTRIADELKRMGEFLKATRVHIHPAADHGYDYSWIASEYLTPPSASCLEIARASFPEFLSDTNVISALCCNDAFKDFGSRYKDALAAFGVKSFILVPLYVNSIFWGVLSIEDHAQTRRWSDSDSQLAATVSNIIAGVIAREITEKQRLEALEHAMEASKAKGDFLSQMSHEMRTPMNVIIGMAAILKNSSDVNAYREGIKKIETAATHLLGVINDILDMSKIEANKLILFEEAFDFRAMINDIKNIINFSVESKRQIFTIAIDPALPDYLIGDRQRLAQVITNLLSNAVKFTPNEGRISLTVQPYEPEEPDGLKFSFLLSVKDTGIGITAEQMPRLFHSFEQADKSTSRKFGGTGLGLSISKHIVELMGGKIWAKSELGQGSEFSFSLALRRGEAPGRENSKNLLPEAYDFSSFRALVAEDIEINREILLALLNPTGLQIDCAENGRRAVDMFAAKEGGYHIIFMDIQMPEMDGYEATRHIRALDLPDAKTVPIIAMTANVFKEDVNNALASGMNAHLVKPVIIDDIMRKLVEYLPPR
ncbi:MAG: response regulator [Syntrophomonadaceae bacterium]|nr:response regulator [Syntrophomonadaceae bacterium]